MDVKHWWEEKVENEEGRDCGEAAEGAKGLEHKYLFIHSHVEN